VDGGRNRFLERGTLESGSSDDTFNQSELGFLRGKLKGRLKEGGIETGLCGTQIDDSCTELRVFVAESSDQAPDARGEVTREALFRSKGRPCDEEESGDRAKTRFHDGSSQEERSYRAKELTLPGCLRRFCVDRYIQRQGTDNTGVFIVTERFSHNLAKGLQ
jgi:hypothetical protein